MMLRIDSWDQTIRGRMKGGCRRRGLRCWPCAGGGGDGGGFVGVGGCGERRGAGIGVICTIRFRRRGSMVG